MTTFTRVSDRAVKRYTHLVRTSRWSIATVSGQKAADSQPGLCVGCDSQGSVVYLRIFRLYENVKRRGGCFQRLADDGRTFASRNEAYAFALERGYLTEYRRAK